MAESGSLASFYRLSRGKAMHGKRLSARGEVCAGSNFIGHHFWY